jgi:hypothetical protein
MESLTRLFLTSIYSTCFKFILILFPERFNLPWSGLCIVWHIQIVTLSMTVRWLSEN